MARYSVIRAGCVLVAISASGCSSHSAYPLTWPAIPETARRTCERVVGTYKDQGQMYGTRYSPSRSLTEVVIGQNERTWRADSVALSFPRAGQFQIGVSGPEGQSLSTAFTTEERRFLCQAGSVILRRPAQWRGGGAGPAIGLGRLSVTLELFSVGDYLVVRRKEHVFMLLGFMVPVVDRETDWYRFERATKVPEGTTDSTRGVDGRGEPPNRRLHPTPA